MGTVEFIANNRSVHWDIIVGFVLRNAFSEHHPELRDQKPHQKILVCVWVWSCFILVMSFSGNLTAMITRPKLDMKFTKMEHFSNQDEMTLVTGSGFVMNEYMNSLPDDSLMKEILLKTETLQDWEEWTSNCFTRRTQFTGRHASICDDLSTVTLLSKSYEKTGKCEWYTLNENIIRARPLAMAFQVGW